ncbi:hypothetical protein D1007_43905 [Hordeum vulgare]|nr:hypothetical protein D1007_43905 [Hordeum vulgare]
MDHEIYKGLSKGMKRHISVKCIEKGEVVSDEYDERSYCLYNIDASTVYGVCAFLVLLLAQLLVTGVTRCLCFGPALSSRG